MGLLPIVAGHTGFGSTALQLLYVSIRQVREVSAFRPRPQDFSAPGMRLASSLPAEPLAQRGQRVDIVV